MSQQLERLLQRCTVKLTIPGKKGWGTGFFVAPELILTCHHVVRDSENGRVSVCWQNRENFEAVIERSLDEFDLALLKFRPSVDNLPCVYLDELDKSFQADDSLYIYGYPDDFSQGASVTGKCEGIAIDRHPLIKFKAGQIRPGLSGSPLLNQRTGKVCGLVKFTRDRSIDLGGGAVPTSEILSQFSELEELQQAFHLSNDRWTRLLPRLYRQKPLSRKEYKNRDNLLKLVKHYWIKGVLEKSLYEQVSIQLNLEERPNLLAQPWNKISDEDSKLLPEGTKIIDLFDEIGAGRTRLILGEPGSGKTTTLLGLARDLIARAEQDVDYPIPVVFNFSSWEVKNQTFEDWLGEELNKQYKVPKKIGQSLVKEDKLLLLLDGLDEIRTEYREQSILALNQFNQNSYSEIVVCSRIKDYETLSNRLNFQSAVYLRLLTPEQVHRYIDNLGSEVTGLKTLIEEEDALLELAKSPLMLNIMVLTYRGVAAEDLPQTNVIEERRKQLFDDYIQRMLNYERIFSYQFASEDERQYSKSETKRWLVWLARKMVQKSQTVFLIEQMQPTWLPKKSLKWLYIITISSIYGLLFGLFVTSSFSEPSKMVNYEVEVAGSIVFLFVLFTCLISFGLPITLILSRHIVWKKPALFKSTISTLPQIWLQYCKIGVLFGSMISLAVFLGSMFQAIVEGFKDFSLLKIIFLSLFIGSGFGLIIFLSTGIVLTLTFPFKEKIPLYRNIKIQNILCEKIEPIESIEWSAKKAISGLFISILLIPVWGIKVGLFYSVIIAIVSGISPSQDIESKTIPNQGIKQSFKTSLVLGWVISIMILASISLDSERIQDIWEFKSFLKIFIVGSIFGAFVGDGGATLKHFILRLLLYRNNYIPWNYARFLDYASERIFLRKVGGGYIFIHRMLMEHFAQIQTLKEDRSY